MEKLKDTCRVIWDFIVEYKAQIAVVLAIWGLFTLMTGAQDLLEEADKKKKIIAMWEEQLPERHWIKSDTMGVLAPTYQSLIGLGSTAFDLSTLTMGQTGDVGSIMEKVMEVEKDTWKSKYVLKYADTAKKVRTIKLEPDESVSLNFYCEDTLQEFDITEKEWVDKYNLWVLSCVEDTDIATINDGEVTAHGKGKTILYLYCDGEIWEYTIKVK